MASGQMVPATFAFSFAQWLLTVMQVKIAQKNQPTNKKHTKLSTFKQELHTRAILTLSVETFQSIEGSYW